MAFGWASVLHSNVTWTPKGDPTNWFGTKMIGGTVKKNGLKLNWIQQIFKILVTFNFQKYSFADGRRNAIRRYTQIRAGIQTVYFVEYQILSFVISYCNQRTTLCQLLSEINQKADQPLFDEMSIEFFVSFFLSAPTMLICLPSSRLQVTLGKGTPSPRQVKTTCEPSRTVIWDAELSESKMVGGTGSETQS